MKFGALLPLLDERQRRLLLGAEAAGLGRGGIAMVAEAGEVSRPLVSRGMQELRAGPVPSQRVRRAGGGRKRLAETASGVLAALEALVDPDSRGDPMSPLRWTVKSTRQLAAELARQGYRVSHVWVAEALHQLGYSLQANAKTIEGRQHPDRDAQFGHIARTVARFLRAKQPVISVDAKKKELVGDDPGYKNSGQQWRPAKTPVKVGVHDFPDPKLGKAIPYGIYDIAANTGWVAVGADGDTAAFAVQTLRRWWDTVGATRYPAATRLLICADAGGSNGYRLKLWKVELARLATEIGLAITVCHFPPGTSKWNKIEHRLFSHITMNWRGRPLISHQVVIDLIAATTTRAGLRVHAEADPNSYPRGIKVSKQELATIEPQLKRDKFHGEWNYTVTPAKNADQPS